MEAYRGNNNSNSQNDWAEIEIPLKLSEYTPLGFQGGTFQIAQFHEFHLIFIYYYYSKIFIYIDFICLHTSWQQTIKCHISHKF